jgi:uncharacterized protein YukE
MADEPWYLAEVTYDDDTGHDAMHELSYAAISLQEALTLVETDIPVVVEDWEREARRVFDDEMPGILEAGHQLVSLLLATATAVEATQESAFEERQLREGLRDAYLTELADNRDRTRHA